MTLHVKEGGTWREASEVHVKDSGVWRDIQEVHIKDGGVWRQVFTSFSASFSGNWASQFDVTYGGTITSNSITCSVSSGTVDVTASITSGSGTSPLLRKNGVGAYLSTQTVSSGDTLVARFTAPAAYNNATTLTADMDGNDTATFTATTEGPP